MFDGLMKSKFYSRCKSDITLMRSRIEIIKKKRNATQKYLRNDAATLLINGFDVDAFGRAEGLLAEMDRSQCYELIDQFCEHILKNLSAMNKQRECPEDCRAAVSTLMFAAARFADLPELRELRTMFSERYSNSLDYYVNKQFSEKLKSDPPSNDKKLRLLQEIAAEAGLEWNSKALENKLFKGPAYDKLVKETNNSDRPSHNRTKGSARKAGTGYEFSQAREPTPERKQDLPNRERKETARNEERMHRKRDIVSPPVEIKEIQVDAVRTTGKPNEAMNLRNISKKDGRDEPPKQRVMIPPPYTKPEVNAAKSKCTNESDSCKGQVEADAEHEVHGGKVVGKSVRTRHPRPSRGEEIAEGVGEREKKREINKENVAHSRRILKFFDGGHDQRDNEEKMMDKLLRHYSKKPGPSMKGKSEEEHASIVKNLRSSSFRVERTEATATQKKHSRAASLQPELVNGYDNGIGHVHPKMPEYDEFVARLAAFRGK